MSESFRVNFGAMKDALAREAFDMTAAEARAAGLCVRCKKPPTFYSDAGRREWAITSLCEPCFDEVTAEPEG